MKPCVFSKQLRSFSIRELGVGVKGLGMDAVDLTVRPGDPCALFVLLNGLPLVFRSLSNPGEIGHLL